MEERYSKVRSKYYMNQINPLLSNINPDRLHHISFIFGYILTKILFVQFDCYSSRPKSKVKTRIKTGTRSWNLVF